MKHAWYNITPSRLKQLAANFGDLRYSIDRTGKLHALDSSYGIHNDIYDNASEGGPSEDKYGGAICCYIGRDVDGKLVHYVSYFRNKNGTYFHAYEHDATEKMFNHPLIDAITARGVKFSTSEVRLYSKYNRGDF